MPLTTLPLEATYKAPVIQVGIGYPASLTDAGDTPDVTQILMLIDTGANQTSISPDVANVLNLPVLGLAPMVSATHSSNVNLYLADMHLTIGPMPYHLTDLKLIEFPMGDSGGLAGLFDRDLLVNGLFQFDGPNSTFTLAF